MNYKLFGILTALEHFQIKPLGISMNLYQLEESKYVKDTLDILTDKRDELKAYLETVEAGIDECNKVLISHPSEKEILKGILNER